MITNSQKVDLGFDALRDSVVGAFKESPSNMALHIAQFDSFNKFALGYFSSLPHLSSFARNCVPLASMGGTNLATLGVLCGLVSTSMQNFTENDLPQKDKNNLKTAAALVAFNCFTSLFLDVNPLIHLLAIPVISSMSLTPRASHMCNRLFS